MDDANLLAENLFGRLFALDAGVRLLEQEDSVDVTDAEEKELNDTNVT